MRVRQRAVALYFIDKLALRAGNEKDDDQADTVGCCSLRVEHITLHKEREGFQSTIFIKLTIEIIWPEKLFPLNETFFFKSQNIAYRTFSYFYGFSLSRLVESFLDSKKLNLMCLLNILKWSPANVKVFFRITFLVFSHF